MVRKPPTLNHMKRSKSRAPRIALALAGGGPLGAIYEIGALCALDEALDGLHFNRLHHYVGVSAGGFIAAGLASAIHSRMALGMKDYERAYRAADIVRIEPDHRDPQLYLANTFSYSQRRRLAQHAYRQTRALLRGGCDALSGKLEPHGVRLRMDVLRDRRRHRLAAPGGASRLAEARASLRQGLDDLGHALRPGMHATR